VGSLSTCQSSVSGYEGVYDLSGNVWELEDSCNGQSGKADLCRIRVGSFLNDSYSLRCDLDISPGRDNSVISVGFRCCSDP